MKDFSFFPLVFLAAGAMITLVGVWAGSRLASGVPLVPSLKFGSAPPEEAEVEHPTVMSARDRNRDERTGGEIMWPVEEAAPVKPVEETDVYPA